MFKKSEDLPEEEKVSKGKQSLGLMAFIILVIGAITMIVNFALGMSNGGSDVDKWYDLVPVILEGIVGLLTYTVFTVVSMGFVKGKSKKVKIPYWISVVVAYAFVLVPMIVDIANFAKQAQ